MLRVLTYHRIADPNDTPELDPTLVSATPEVFGRHMRHLRRWYSPVGLEDVIEAFTRGRPLPSRAVHVTVDDAYRDFRAVAWPILRDLGIPVTLFVPTAFPEAADRSFWWDRLHRARVENGAWRTTLAAVAEAGDLPLPNGDGKPFLRNVLRLIPHDAAERLVDQACVDGESEATRGGTATSVSPVLDWDALRELKREGVTIGAHTREHVALPCVDLPRVRHEIRRSLDDLNRELGPGPAAVAYPYGMCNATIARIAREEGCAVGFTGQDGLNRPGAVDPLRLRRSNISSRTSPPVFAIRMLPWCADVDRWRLRHKVARPVA